MKVDFSYLHFFFFFYHLVFSLCVISHSKERSYNDEHNRRKDHFCLNAKVFAIVNFMCSCLHCDAPVSVSLCVCVCGLNNEVKEQGRQMLVDDGWCEPLSWISPQD